MEIQYIWKKKTEMNNKKTKPKIKKTNPKKTIKKCRIRRNNSLWKRNDSQIKKEKHPKVWGKHELVVSTILFCTLYFHREKLPGFSFMHNWAY